MIDESIEPARSGAHAEWTVLRSIPVRGAKPWREPEDELGAFEFIKPFGHGQGQGVFRRGDQPGRARGAEPFGGELAVNRKGALAVTGDLEPVLDAPIGPDVSEIPSGEEGGRNRAGAGPSSGPAAGRRRRTGRRFR